jgi:hypothetical protein
LLQKPFDLDQLLAIVSRFVLPDGHDRGASSEFAPQQG